MSNPNLRARDRRTRAQKAIAEAGLDAVLITPGADLHYLTGYPARLSERLTCLLLPAVGDPVLFVPALEHEAAQSALEGELGSSLEVSAWQETEDPVALVAARLGAVSAVGIANHMWAEQVLAFRDALPGVTQHLAGRVLADLRVRKGADEIGELRLAAAAIDRVHARMGEWLRVGRTEREVGRDIGEAILAEGHSRVDFVIVASGPNGASPHHELSDRTIEVGDTVVVDIGGTTEAGYCSDSTRTYALGQPSAEAAAAFEVLLRAQKAGCDAVRPGVTASSVDQITRAVIADAGYGDYFIHRTGHGIGLETHEGPYIVTGNDEVLEPGMAFSIEPGIYVHGRHGARIEDIVVCTDVGGERLNVRPRELVILGG